MILQFAGNFTLLAANYGLIIIIVVLVLWFIGWISDSADGDSNQVLQSAIDAGLGVRCTHDIYVAEDGSQLPTLKVEVTGTVAVPHNQFPASFRIRITDASNDLDEPHAVFCTIDSLADEDGLFTLDQELTVPHQYCELTDMHLADLPVFALTGPKRGTRQYNVMVFVTPQNNTENCFAFGEQLISHEQSAVGYLEFREYTLEQDKRVAMLALAVSAADGKIDKRESTAIRRFFNERLMGSTDEDERKNRVNTILKETVKVMRSGAEKPAKMIERLAAEIHQEQDIDLSQDAFELVLSVIAADDVVEEKEQRVIEYVANRLELPDGFVREAKDRKLRVSMLSNMEDESLVGMPHGLSTEEKLEFLNSEYQKWRRRVTHSDPQTATEAAQRVEQITRLRQKLTQSQ